MGLHVGQVERRNHGYVGLEIHRAARIGAVAHGGQILMSAVASELLRGIVPSQALGAHRLKDFPAPIGLFCAVVDGRGAAAFPPPRTLELREGNLPVASTTLIGREHDLERIRAALQGDGERLVTLLGRGGVGKTSLALAAANELFEEYDGGVWWIEANQEHGARALCSLIARICKISADDRSAEAAVIADLRPRGKVLLVLDNVEQIPDAAQLLDSLLERLPDVSVLATSQLPVRGRWERRLQLDRLSESEAMTLLSRCAARLDVPLADEVACTELIGLLDGLPLAIELAAGRLGLFGPAELVRRLRDSTAVLQDRGRADRHRSLTAALDWTLGLLDPDANAVFIRLGVFAGPVGLEDIEAVAGDDGVDLLSALATLLDTALLHRVESGDGLVRFGFPEAIRQEAARRLDQTGAEWHRAHAVWQRDLVWPVRIFESVESHLVERAQAAVADTQAALEWAWTGDRQLWREIALGRYSLAYRVGALREQRALLDRLLADPGTDPRVADLVREHAALRAQALRRNPSPAALMSLFAELSDPHARYLCALNTGISLTLEHRHDEALIWNERALALAREVGPLASACTLEVRADTLLEAGRADEAELALDASDAAAGRLRSTRGDAIELLRARVASLRGAHAEAFDRYARAVTHAELVGDRAAIDLAIWNLGPALALAGLDREMLEVAGMANAVSAERSEHGMPGVLDGQAPAVRDALAKLGAAGEAALRAGEELDPVARAKRICALLNAQLLTAPDPDSQRIG